LFRVEQAEQPAERIVAGRGIGRQIDDGSEVCAVRRGKVGNVDATPRATQRRRERDEQQRRQLVLGRVVARIVNGSKDRQNRFHAEGLLKQGTPLRIPILALGKRFFLCAIRLPHMGASPERGFVKTGASR
jgi:hypothetical protein